MNASAFEYFHIVARAGSVARAAIELEIEPSTLARHIGRLEEDVGTRLFHRSGRGMTLTDAGVRLLAETDRLVDRLAHTRRTASLLASGGPARIDLTAQPTIAHVAFGAIGTALGRRFPGARLRLEEAYGHEIVAHLQGGTVDLALLYLPAGTHLAEHEVLLQERLHCVMPVAWEPPAQAMEIDAVLELPLILPSSAHGLRGLVAEWAQARGRPLKVPVECDGSASLSRRLVQAGLGCTVLPLASVHEDVAAGRLVSVPIAGDAALRTVVLATARNRAPLPGLWDVIQVIRAEMAALVERGGWPGVDRMSDTRVS